MPRSAQVRRRGRDSAHKNHHGVYTLIIRSSQPCRITVGRCLSISLERSLYIYTGSAVGRGSTSLEGRITRHLRQEKKRFWHIDRILSSGSARVASVVFAETARKMECKTNTALLKDSCIVVPVRGVGSTDCKCESHFLMTRYTLGVLRQKVRLCYAKLGLRPRVLEDRRALGLAYHRTSRAC
jgi:Uri superfamily endonuclease